MYISMLPRFSPAEIYNTYAVYVIIYVSKIGKTFVEVENWFLECDEVMQTTCIHATGCVNTISCSNFVILYFKWHLHQIHALKIVNVVKAIHGNLRYIY